MTESSSSDSLRDALECRIRSEEFRDPRMLPCKHTFCLACLERTCPDKQPGENTPCPFCRKEFQLPDIGIGGIPDKFVDLCHTSSDIVTSPMCDVCPEAEDTHVANVFCVECDQNICELCIRSHKKTPALKDHHVGDLKNKELIEKQKRKSSTQYRISEDNVIAYGYREPCPVSYTEVGSAKCVRFYYLNFEKPTCRVALELPCYCSDQSEANRIVDHSLWICVDCECLLEYAFDEYFYCKCGRAECGNFRFKCNRLNNGGEFKTFQPEYIQKMLGKIKRKEEINILLLGETGVGKSTWINSIVNYMSYPSLEEAAKSEVLSVIGGSFTITTGDFESKEIKISEDKNEDHSTGQSATQYPKSYLFEQETRLVRFIDTPGIGDIRGIETDKKNFDNIMKYLANFDKLNGVCILIKPNNPRPNVHLRYYLSEISTHLHKDASKNIVYCFTNTRNTFYRPGDTLSALEVMLEKNRLSAYMSTNKKNVFCLDNEAFRFLCARREGTSFDVNDMKQYSESWERSAAETNRLIDYVADLHPHALRDTLSLNNIRKYSTILMKPMVDITQIMSMIKDKKQELKSCNGTKAELEKILHIPTFDLVRKDLPFQRSSGLHSSSRKTVCVAPKCANDPDISVLPIKDIKHCHDPCYCFSTVICPELTKCIAIKDGICRKCGCSSKTHIHINKTIKKETIEKAIQSNASDKEKMSMVAKCLKIRMRELEEEQGIIADQSGYFEHYVANNAMPRFNDALPDYLDMLIGKEAAKVETGGDEKVLAGINHMKESYYREKEIWEKGMITFQRPYWYHLDLVQTLCNLKVNEKKWRETFESAEENQEMMTLNETAKLAWFHKII